MKEVELGDHFTVRTMTMTMDVICICYRRNTRNSVDKIYFK